MTTSEAQTAVLPSLDPFTERPDLVCDLPRGQRDPLLAFLADWGPAEQLLACADALIEGSPRLIVSSLDLRARALVALGRHDEALDTVRQRLAKKDSFTGRLLLIGVQLASGDAASARATAEGMAAESPDSTMSWQALAEVELAEGRADAALDALHRLGEIVPDHRAYLLGMARAHALRQDWVTATSFAIRLIEAAAGRFRLSVAELRRLGDVFRAAGEATRAQDVDEELASRLAADGEGLAAALAALPEAGAAQVAEPEGREAPDERLTAPETVPVSPEERERIAAAARSLFGFAEMLPGQVETIACALRGESVLTILPTGGGKSLCFQLPAFLEASGVTLVVSPLIALMQDQWQHVPEALRGQATFVNSQVEGDELGRRVAAIAEGAYRLVYAAPERLRQPPFIHALRRAVVNRLVIDEAHCVSVWGHEFRPDYLALTEAWEQLGQPPVLALTATAPERVRRDVLRQLGDMRVVATDPRRPNLRFDVIRTPDLDGKYRLFANLCATAEGSGIVYAGTRGRCEELAALLRRLGQSAEHYHAGIDDRTGAQERFMSGETRIMVATNAFGLGVDKPDVRFVLHFLPPDSLESYYQEAGRAGRDGLAARCVLLISPSSDKGTLTRHANQDNVPLDYLRSLYAAVRSRLRGAACGRVAAADLMRDVANGSGATPGGSGATPSGSGATPSGSGATPSGSGATPSGAGAAPGGAGDEVRQRVALGILQQAGLLGRGPDVPRSVTLTLTQAGRDAPDPELAALREGAHLVPGQPLTLDPVEVARRAGLSPLHIEHALLGWQDRGWLRYRPSARDLLFELPPAPDDASRRVADLLEILASVRKQRVSDMVAYTSTRRCRHGYLSRYLGGSGPAGCAACDNCLPCDLPPDSLPGEREQALVILRTLAASRYGWGRANLARILRGDAEAPEVAQRSEGYGALAFRSDAAVGALIVRLTEAGLIESHQLEHGGTVLLLAKAGAAALKDPSLLEPALSTGLPEAVAPSPQEAGGVEVHAGLLEALRRWRKRQAGAEGVPAYVILWDSHLRAIAAASPRTLDALGRVKGIGPARLARYGDALLAVVLAATGE